MHNDTFFAFVIMDDSLGGISKSAVPVNPQRRRWNHEGGNTEGLRKVWGRISRQGLENKSQHMFNSAYKFKYKILSVVHSLQDCLLLDQGEIFMNIN